MNIWPYIQTLLPCVGLWAVIFLSPLLQTLLSIVLKRTMTSVDVEDWLVNGQHWRLFKLYTCLCCQSWWTTVLAAAAYCEIYGALWQFPVTALALYPVTLLITSKLSTYVHENNSSQA